MSCAEKIIKDLVDVDKVAIYFGLQRDPSEKDSIVAKDMDAQKTAIQMAFKSMVAVYYKSEKVVEFDAKMIELEKWLTDDPKLTLYKSWRLKGKGMYGMSLKMINKYLEKSAGKDVDVTKGLVELREVILRDDLKWLCWGDYYKAKRFVTHPVSKDIAW